MLLDYFLITNICETPLIVDIMYSLLLHDNKINYRIYTERERERY